MRKKLIAALATKFSGVEAKVLGRIADNLMHDKTIESDEDVNSAVEEVTFADILKSYGDSRAAEASKSAVSNYEKKHGLKDGKPAGQTEEDEDTDGDSEDGDEGGEKKSKKSEAKKSTQKEDNNASPEMAAMMKLMKQMGEKLEATATEIASLKKGKVTETRKARLAEVLKGLKETQKKAYTRLPLDSYSDEDFDSLIDEITDEVEELAKDNGADGGSFESPLGGGSHGNGKKEKEATDAEVESIISNLSV